MRAKRLPQLILGGIVIVYIVVGALYAVYTPAWQVPDEPAHYNYVRQLAEDERFPVMEVGDYDAAYLELLKSQKFPPELSIAAVEYEDHQPPLYYLLASPVYLLFGGAVLPLRLLSVAFGAALLIVVFGTVRAIFPIRSELALAAAAFIAFIPQHVAMTAGVNNDALGELIVGATLWSLVVYLGGEGDRPWPIGLLLAAALLTKVSAYVVVPLAVVAVAVRWRRERRPWRWAAAQWMWLLVPALLISAPWFIRNGLTYGWHDLVGQARHDLVVEGQLTTAQFLADKGWGRLLGDMASTTFNSFWGQFGWMAVPLQARFYQVLLAFSLILLGGFLWWLFDRRRPSLTGHQRLSLSLLLASGLLSTFVFLGYNAKFLQHQGRYLFPALIPLGMAVALGLGQLAGILPVRVRRWAMGVPFIGMAFFAVYCLFRVVVPFLA